MSTEPARSLRFVRNVGYNALGQAAVAAAAFFAIPYLVARLGLEAYGLYVVLQATAGYLMLLALGAGSVTLRFVASGAAAGRRQEIFDAARFGFLFYGLGLGAGALLLQLGARPFLSGVFAVPEPWLDMGVFVLACAAAGAFCAGLAQAAGSVLQGLQRFDLQNVIVFLQNGLMPVGAAAAVAAGLGLKGVSLWYVALNAAACGLALWLALRLLRPLRSLPEGEPLGLGRFFSWSVSQWLGPVAWIVMFQLDKVFIARGESLAALTLYAVPAGLLQRLQALPAAVSVVTIPMMSEVGREEGDEGLRRVYMKSVRFLLWTALPLLVLLFALMPQFLSLWLGGEFGSKSVWPARLLVLAHGFWMLGTTPNAVFFAKERPWYIPATAWAQAALSVLAWSLFIPRYGLVGAAAGTLLAMALPVCACLWALHARVLSLPFSEYAARALYAPGLSAACALAAVFPLRTWATGWASLAAISLLGLLIYYGSTWLLMADEDRRQLRGFLRWQPAGA